MKRRECDQHTRTDDSRHEIYRDTTQKQKSNINIPQEPVGITRFGQISRILDRQML